MKCGFVAILGRPNVGKSTLLNSILNKKISIVTDKSQTTRNTIKGILTKDDAQIIFLDTPGIHKPHQKLGENMDIMAYSAAHDADVNILVVDASENFGTGDEFLLNHLDINNSPLFILINKIDKSNIMRVQNLKNTYSSKFPNANIIETVATEKFNIDYLIEELIKALPESPFLFPVETKTDKDEIFHIKEIIREKVLKELRDEVPHSIAIYLNDIDWDASPIKVFATIFVEKDSQKGIVIGAGGKRIKSIGLKSRRDIENLLNKHIYLELKVSVSEDWRNQSKELETFGYKIQD